MIAKAMDVTIKFMPCVAITIAHSSDMLLDDVMSSPHVITPLQGQAQGYHSISMDQRLQKPFMEERYIPSLVPRLAWLGIYKTQFVPVGNFM